MDQIPALMSGFEPLDHKLWDHPGLPASCLAAITGHSGHGRSSLLTQMAANLIQGGNRVLMVDLELSLGQSLLRLQRAGVDLDAGAADNWELCSDLAAGMERLYEGWDVVCVDGLAGLPQRSQERVLRQLRAWSRSEAALALVTLACDPRVPARELSAESLLGSSRGAVVKRELLDLLFAVHRPELDPGLSEDERISYCGSLWLRTLKNRFGFLPHADLVFDIRAGQIRTAEQCIPGNIEASGNDEHPEWFYEWDSAPDPRHEWSAEDPEAWADDEGAPGFDDAEDRPW